MKKLICVFLILMFTVIFSITAFAAQEDIPEQPIPETGDTTTVDVYEDEEVPQSADIVDANVPAAAELVQTGGIPAELFYAGGGLCIVGALFMSKKKTKDATK